MAASSSEEAFLNLHREVESLGLSPIESMLALERLARERGIMLPSMDDSADEADDESISSSPIGENYREDSDSDGENPSNALSAIEIISHSPIQESFPTQLEETRVVSDSDSSDSHVFTTDMRRQYVSTKFRRENPDDRVYSIQTLYALIPGIPEFDRLRGRLQLKKVEYRYDPAMSNRVFESRWSKSGKKYSDLKKERKRKVFLKPSAPICQGSTLRRIRQPPFGGKDIRPKSREEIKAWHKKMRAKHSSVDFRPQARVVRAKPKVLLAKTVPKEQNAYFGRNRYKQRWSVPSLYNPIYKGGTMQTVLFAQLDREILSRAPKVHFVS